MLEKLLKTPKKMATLGLIGTIIMLVPILKFIFGEDFFEFGIVSIYHTYFWGLLIYFIIVVFRLFKLKGNIRVANFILIISLGVSIIGNILANSWINVIVLAILELYLINIFLRKNTFINNKIACVVFVLYIFYSIKFFDFRIYFFVENGFDFATQIVGYLFIIPYFYGYYELLKGEKENGK